MSSQPRSAYLVNGAVVGGVVASNIERIGLVGGFGGVGIGMVPVIGAGVVMGAATYGFKSMVQGDRMAIGAFGLGTIGGVGISASIGGMGLAGSFGAIRVGAGVMGLAGGVVGLGLYGVAKMLDSSPPESAFQAFDRMADNIDEQCHFQQAYMEAFLELMLGEDDPMVQFMKWDVEPELQKLKSKVQSQSQYQTQLLHSGCMEENQIGDCIQILHHHTEEINTIAVHPNGHTIATGSDDGMIVLWDLQTGGQIHQFYLVQPVRSVSISPDGKTIIGACDQTISIWNLETKHRIGIFSKPTSGKSHDGMIQDLCFSGDSQLVVSASSDRTLQVWKNDHRSIIQEKLKRTLTGHTNTVFSVAVSRDGQRVVTGSADSTIRIWDLTSWAEAQVLTGHQGWVNTIALSPDERVIASGGGDGILRLWSAENGEGLGAIPAHTGMIRSVIFSSKDNHLASSGIDGAIRLWKFTVDRANNHTFITQNNVLSGQGPIAFTMDDLYLINGQEDGRVKIWQI